MAPPPPVAKRGSGVRVVRAMYDYTAVRSDELSISEGDLLYVLDASGEWWLCRSGGRQGLIPFNYVEEHAETVEHPLHEAAKRGNVELLKEALEVGLSVNTLDHSGATPLHWASRGGHDEAVRLLLQRKPVLDVKNKLGDTPLHMAAWGGHPAVIKTLLEAGAARDLLNNEGQSPYQLAKSRSPEAAALLQVIHLNHGDVDSGDESD
ncbi:hypothetical protein H696_02300 [Fonticula alba]|uniref:Osteoclast-stimulating factor 1 n=1 Tax=Fonticula alba TaxID=691883 RepID=A0A058ZD37_FONAL|nr:hypothetical protein H696_02300 [Fonticula alba]KCV71352.1 hypothetical protein H696_02300 [Fonticula alba]|eukprot:XP_009494475.1 hypothetical protein H696_02300 [Fonticula alba]